MFPPLAAFCLAVCAAWPSLAQAQSPPATPLFEDRFTADTGQWISELEKGGTVTARDGVLTIDVPGGATVWFKQPLQGPVAIEYDAAVIVAGGPNDRLSDLNCFWMARDSRSPDDLFQTKRNGSFADYNQLLTYYVGHGGNANTTTRFRRYIGDKALRPLLPEHDLSEPQYLLKPNATQRIRLIADGGRIAYHHNGRKIFEYRDPAPYTSGWFGFRTVASHLEIRNFRILRLSSSDSPER